MYLKNFKIKNFRLAKETEINFQKGLNILIGPNNAGKTTIIDAIRICLNYGNQNNVRVKKEDFNDINKEIEFNLFFEKDTEIESAIFLELFNPLTNCLEITFKYTYNNIYDRVFSEIRGVNKENSLPNELFQFIYNINLDALRDANRFLSPGRNNILSDFFNEAISQNEQEEIMDSINNFISESKANRLINKYKNKHIQEHYKNLSFENEEDKLIVSPIDQEFDEFTKKLKIQLLNSSNNTLDLNQNGLGYNNLIYISVLLSHLNTINNRTDETIYTSLCIEEPEAHLHPQLEKLFFSYLNQLNTENENNPLQIFISTHSPTLTSKTNADSLILIKNTRDNIIALSLKDSKLKKENKIYLEKFLDVTKSQLLFSKKVIFVEGISEEILIPILAKQESIDFDKYGIELVNVNGINFKHFAPLFNKRFKLIEKGIILTDGDQEKLNGNISKACQNIKDLSEDNDIGVYVSNKTFEFDLLNTNERNSIIWKEFRKKHKNIFKNLEMSEEELFDKFNNNSIKKSEIAYNIAIKLKEKPEKIKIPKYIKEAFDDIKEER